jgi:tetratricopeptide (TPR) repeat protein
MVFSRHSLTILAAIGGMLLAGCSSVSQPGAAAARNGGTHATAPSAAVDEDLVQAHAHYAQGLIYEMDNDEDAALVEFSQAALNDPRNEELALELTRRFVQRKEPEKAEEILVKAAQVPGASCEIFARLGMVYSRLGKTEQALAASETAVKRDPRSMAGYRNLFIVNLQRGKPLEAQKVLDRAAKTTGTTVEFDLELAELYANLERQAPSLKAAMNPNALAVVSHAAKLSPANPNLRLKLADDFNVLGDPTNAARIYLQILDQFTGAGPLRDEVRVKLADIYLRTHDSPKAVEQLEAIVRDNPANARVYYLLGSLAVENRKTAEAADYFEKALMFDENTKEVYYDLAQAQINLDKPKDAVATLDKARAKFQESFLSEFLRGLVEVRENNFTNALSHFKAAESLVKPDEQSPNGYFYFELGAAHERLGEIDAAENCFQQCLKLAPDLAEALNYLGYMWAERGVKLDQAHELIQKAVKLEPKSYAYLDSLAWVLYKLHRPQEALPQVQKAIELSPKPDATLFDHLGDIYVALKQPDKAREAWRKSVSVEPNPEVQKKIDRGADAK